MRHEDDLGRVCDPETVCKGLGIHYHCPECWKVGGFYVHVKGNIRTCTGEKLWND